MKENEIVGSYRIKNPLGSASSTFLAEHKDTGELHVLKVFRGKRVNPSTWSEICQIVRAFPGRSGPVCVLSEVNFQGHEIYAVAPFLRGENLAQIIRAISRNRNVTVQTAHQRAVAWVMADLIDGVMCRGSEMFEHPVFDRDMVSPHELFVLFDGTVQVLDVRWTWLRALVSGSPWSSLERNLPYVAPRSDKSALNSDAGRTWALGVMLWELLVGYRLFRRNSLEATMHALAEKEVPNPRSMNPHITKEMSQLVLRTLSHPGAISLFELQNRLRELSGLRTDIAPAFVQNWLSQLFPAREVSVSPAEEPVSEGVATPLNWEDSSWSLVEESTTCISPPPTLTSDQVVQLSWLEDSPEPQMKVVQKKEKTRIWPVILVAFSVIAFLLVLLGRWNVLGLWLPQLAFWRQDPAGLHVASQAQDEGTQREWVSLSSSQRATGSGVLELNELPGASDEALYEEGFAEGLDPTLGGSVEYAEEEQAASQGASALAEGSVARSAVEASRAQGAAASSALRRRSSQGAQHVGNGAWGGGIAPSSSYAIQDQVVSAPGYRPALAQAESKDRTGDILIQAPRQVEVFLGNRSVGKGTFRLRLPEGQHTFRVQGPSGPASYVAASVTSGALSIVEIQ